MKTLLVVAPGRGSGERVYNLLVAETDEHLYSHLCSNHSFAIGDLTRRTERVEELSQRFGEYEVKFIDETDLPEETLIERFVAWNKKESETNETSNT